MQPAQKERYTKFALLVHGGMNATKAAIECGYSQKSAGQQGKRMSRNVYVCQELERLRAETAEKLDGKLLDSTELLQRLAALTRDDGNKDRQLRALELYGRHHKLWVDRVEQTTTTVEEGVKQRTDARLSTLKLVDNDKPTAKAD